MTRVQYQDKIESTRLAVLTGNAAFSGKLEAVDKVTDAWAKAIGAESAPLKAARGALDMMKDFPGGI